MSAPAAQEDRLIGTLPKNSREAISVMLRTFKGHKFVDVRVMFAGKDDTLQPTGKGAAGLTVRSGAMLIGVSAAAAGIDPSGMVTASGGTLKLTGTGSGGTAYVIDTATLAF